MTESPGVLFEQLLSIMDRLRGPEGCPWDRLQTLASLKPFLVEEVYEVLDAIEAEVPSARAEELGDLLFQIVFQARIAGEQGEFTMADVLEALIGKMIRRHPHVFGDASVASPREALNQWEDIKRREADAAGRYRSLLEGVPRGLPSLLRAQRLQEKAARARFDWPDARAAWSKVEEELRETAGAVDAGDRERIQEELGDLLFSLVNVARLSTIDPEDALRGAMAKFTRRFTQMEKALSARGTSVGTASPDEMEDAWMAVKARERAARADTDNAAQGEV